MSLVEAKNKNGINLAHELSSALSQSSENEVALRELNSIKTMRQTVNYISKLKNEGKISDSQFTEILIDVCTNFVENEVEQRMLKYFNNSLFLIFSH